MTFLRPGFSAKRRVLVLLMIAAQWKERSVQADVPYVPDDKSEDKSSRLFTKTTLFERISYLYNNSLMSDIKFANGAGEVFYAHKYILAASSPIFYESFYGDNATNVSSINLPGSYK